MTNLESVIELIEDSPFSADDRFTLVLVALGLKPATLIGLSSSSWRDGQSAHELCSAEVQHATEVVQAVGAASAPLLRTTSAGLPQRTSRPRRWRQMADFCVGKDQPSCDRLVAAWPTKAEPIDHRALGEALGFPATAIDGFVNRTPVIDELVPLSVRLTDAWNCRIFKPSAAHWRDELIIKADYLYAVKAVSPEIHMRYRLRSRVITDADTIRLMELADDADKTLKL
jgi:hypothetical protein